MALSIYDKGTRALIKRIESDCIELEEWEKKEIRSIMQDHLSDPSKAAKLIAKSLSASTPFNFTPSYILQFIHH